MFITPYGVFCYNTMPFGLKNARATYQRCIQDCLREQIGRNVQVYVDDVVITARKADALIDDLRETFDNLDRFKIKLNPTKCAFGVPAGQLLGYFISARGIEAREDSSNPHHGEAKRSAWHPVTSWSCRSAKSIHQQVG